MTIISSQNVETLVRLSWLNLQVLSTIKLPCLPTGILKGTCPIVMKCASLKSDLTFDFKTCSQSRNVPLFILIINYPFWERSMFVWPRGWGELFRILSGLPAWVRILSPELQTTCHHPTHPSNLLRSVNEYLEIALRAQPQAPYQLYSCQKASLR